MFEKYLNNSDVSCEITSLNVNCCVAQLKGPDKESYVWGTTEFDDEPRLIGFGVRWFTKFDIP